MEHALLCKERSSDRVYCNGCDGYECFKAPTRSVGKQIRRKIRDSIRSLSRPGSVAAPVVSADHRPDSIPNVSSRRTSADGMTVEDRTIHLSPDVVDNRSSLEGLYEMWDSSTANLNSLPAEPPSNAAAPISELGDPQLSPRIELPVCSFKGTPSAPVIRSEDVPLRLLNEPVYTSGFTQYWPTLSVMPQMPWLTLNDPSQNGLADANIPAHSALPLNQDATPVSQVTPTSASSDGSIHGLFSVPAAPDTFYTTFVSNQAHSTAFSSHARQAVVPKQATQIQEVSPVTAGSSIDRPSYPPAIDQPGITGRVPFHRTGGYGSGLTQESMSNQVHFYSPLVTSPAAVPNAAAQQVWTAHEPQTTSDEFRCTRILENGERCGWLPRKGGIRVKFKGYLKKHEKTHDKENRGRCPECDKICSLRQDNLKTHLERHCKGRREKRTALRTRVKRRFRALAREPGEDEEDSIERWVEDCSQQWNSGSPVAWRTPFSSS